MKIAILGASGFIGQHLVHALYHDYDIFAFGRKISPFPDEVSYTQWDIHSPISFPDEFDVCIHLASDVDYEKSRETLYETNVASLKYILPFLKTAGCKHCIYVSSSSVYMGISGIIREDVPLEKERLTNSYASTKLLAEEVLKKILSNTMKITIVRPRAVYGDGDTTLLPKILESQFLSYLFLPGSGNIKTSVTSVENLIQSILVVIKHQKTPCEIYNVSDEHAYAYGEIYALIVEKYGLKGIIRIPRFLISMLSFLFPNRWSYIFDIFFQKKVLDISKIRKLGYTPKGDISSFLKNYEKLSKNPHFHR